MLRITREMGLRSQTLLRIEGSLVAEWVGLLLRECFAALRSPEVLRLDLEGVDFVDRAGIEALGRLSRAGVEIRCPPGSVASVLEDAGVLVTGNEERVGHGRHGPSGLKPKPAAAVAILGREGELVRE